MAGEETKTTQTTDPMALLAQLLSGNIGGAVAQGSVYLGGTSGTRQVTMKRTGQVVNIPTENISTVQQANAKYLTDAKLQVQWRKAMQKNGLETGNPLVERRAWETAVAGASDWYATSNGAAKITPEQYLQWWAGGSKGKAKPKADLARQVYQYSPEQIDADINEVALKLLGREITDADKQADWYNDLTKGLNKMIGKGIVTTSELVKNKKTGKLEQVTTQTPKFTKEAAQAKITETLSTADPISLERRKNLEFANWAFEKMGVRR